MLLLTLTVSTLFIHVPHKGELGFLLNHEVVLSYNQYFWMLTQHLIMITLAAIIYDEARTYRGIVRVYLYLTIADCIMWFFFYDDPLKDYRITWNIIKNVIFIGSIATEKWMQSVKE